MPANGPAGPAGGSGAGRATTMARRIDRTGRRLGIPDDARDLLLQAFRAAMDPRRERLADDHHPDYLHPARTALILMDDARLTDPMALATAVFVETRDPSLAATTRAIERVSPGVAAQLARIPHDGRPGEPLVEALLALPPVLAMVAAAERLDHARHLHLREREEWREYHATTCDAYAPVARRAHARLGERLDWWCSTFRRRFLED